MTLNFKKLSSKHSILLSSPVLVQKRETLIIVGKILKECDKMGQHRIAIPA